MQEHILKVQDGAKELSEARTFNAGLKDSLSHIYNQEEVIYMRVRATIVIRSSDIRATS